MSNPNYKTSICKYAFIGCKQQQKCWYAHNKEELRQRYCVNGTNCVDNNCCYLHPNKNVDKDEYYLKILLKSDILGLDKNNIKHQLDMIKTKIIIEIDNDTDEEFDEDLDLNLDKMNLNEEDKKDNEDKDNKDKDNEDKDNEDKDNKEDEELKNYIDNFSQQWLIKPEQFYDTIDNKNELNLKIKANDLQIQMLTHFMKSINIEFNIESFVRN